MAIILTEFSRSAGLLARRAATPPATSYVAGKPRPSSKTGGEQMTSPHTHRLCPGPTPPGRPPVLASFPRQSPQLQTLPSSKLPPRALPYSSRDTEEYRLWFNSQVPKGVRFTRDREKMVGPGLGKAMVPRSPAQPGAQHGGPEVRRRDILGPRVCAFQAKWLFTILQTQCSQRSSWMRWKDVRCKARGHRF